MSTQELPFFAMVQSKKKLKHKHQDNSSSIGSSVEIGGYYFKLLPKILKKLVAINLVLNSLSIGYEGCKQL